MYFVYILECADASLYAGCTNDLARRVRQHNGSPKGARYTRARRPVSLVYAEKFRTLRKALQREIEIKKWPREKKLQLVKAPSA